MCKGLLANFLLSPLEIICLLDKDGELILFIVEEAGDTVLVGVVNAGFELGAEIGDALEVSSIDFFLVLAALLPLLTDLTCPK